MDWLVDRTARLLPRLRISLQIEDSQLIEVAWDIVRHYVRVDLAKGLKTKLREIFPTAFPDADRTVLIAPEPEVPPPIAKPKSPGKPASKRREVKPVTKGGIDSFFAPVKKTPK
jgi:hypothetical protein